MTICHTLLLILLMLLHDIVCPVDWICRIYRLHLCRGVRFPNDWPGYDTKQSDGEAAVMLELWVMWSTLIAISSRFSLARSCSTR